MNPEAPQLSYKARLYSTDAKTQTISRKASGKIESIKTSDSKFNQFICSPRADITAVIKEIGRISYQCEKWRDGSSGFLDQLSVEENFDGVSKD